MVKSVAVISGWIYEKKLVDIKQRMPTEKFQSFTKELTIIKIFDFGEKEIPKKE